MPARTVALISYQPIILEGLIRTIGAEDQLSVVFSGICSPESYASAMQLKPDLFLLDCGTSDLGIALISRIRTSEPAAKIACFAGQHDVEHAVRVLDAGAHGYISSTCTAEEIVSAIKLVLDGGTFISPRMAAKVISALRSVEKARAEAVQRRLSYREEQIAGRLMLGLTNREIALELGITEKTVKHYMTALFQKFQARNRLELALALPKNADVSHNTSLN